MVSRRRRPVAGVVAALAVLLVALLTAVGSGSGAAHALGGETPPSNSDNGGSTGGNDKTGSDGKCTFYAVAGRFGFACGSGDPRTVRQILDGDPLPTCWDEVIVTSKLADYGYTSEPADGHYYIQS
jgi:hypothetical protein